jgi:AcrR family transcriptional regulator
MNPKQRIIEAALELAIAKGWRKVSRGQIAERLNTVPSSINYYVGTKDQLRDEIMVEAVKRRIVSIVAEGLVYNNKAAVEAPIELRRQAQKYADLRGMKVPRWLIVDDEGTVTRAWK